MSSLSCKQQQASTTSLFRIFVHMFVCGVPVHQCEYDIIQGTSLAHEEEQNKMRMKRTERSMFLDATWRLLNAKNSVLKENKPDAACMNEIGRTERKSNIITSTISGTLAAPVDRLVHYMSVGPELYPHTHSPTHNPCTRPTPPVHPAVFYIYALVLVYTTYQGIF